MQERDLRLLRALAVMRVVDREQAMCAAGFGSTTRVNTRLLALTRMGLLRRFFMGGDGSGQKALYALSPKGAMLAEVPYRGLRRGRDEVLVADFFVIHQLWVNRLHCLLQFQPIPIEGAKFLRWEGFTEPIDTGKELIPDGYVEIKAKDSALAAFLEVDLGHERGAVWPRKIESYLRYAISGEFSRRFGRPQFRALVVAPSERRMQALRTRAAKLTEKIFWFTTFEAIRRDGFWSAIWQRPAADRRRALLESHP